MVAKRIGIIGLIAVAVLLACVCVLYTAAGQIGAIGSISVSSEPSGADISLDGVPINAITPYTIQHLDPGTHTIELFLEGYQDWGPTDVQVTSGETSVVHAALTPIPTPTPTPPATGSISVTSDPSGATIELDTPAGPFVGPSVKTPYTFTKVEPGTCTIKLSLEGYQDWGPTDVQVRAGSTSYVHATLTPIVTTGSISISSSPSGANVYLDHTYKGITPLTITDVSHGHHSIELTLAGYQPWPTSVEVKAGETSYVSATLTPTPPATGSISASSSPSGARIYVDGSYKGRTPETITHVSPGSHAVKLKRDGYYDWSTRIDVTAGSTSYVSASLTPIPYPTVGFISVSSSPSGAYIHLDGSYKGTTPKTITHISPGSHTIELEHSGYYDWTSTVRVKAGSTSYISTSLTPNPSPTTGFISVTSSPSGANIYLDGAYQGRTSASEAFIIVAIAPGHHTVSLDLSGYQHWETGVDVTVGGTSHVSASLVPSSPPPPSTTGTISVSSSPSGANVYMDNAYKGITPLTITDVSSGTHTIEVKLEGYQDWSTSVQVTAGGTASVPASLTLSPTPTPTPKAPTTVLCVIVALVISGIIAVTKRRESK